MGKSVTFTEVTFWLQSGYIFQKG
ncbi:uncharacterized protein METZ01_LOCUS212860 [marine metagenome]|uniref:Uncharacterized protein n=1 Tax=marine metagenome TaxID=408172 RepID=A0A382FAA4_9ZZZZ